jgi:tripartite-type tricarboxylate transporter receptor subunit TctC
MAESGLPGLVMPSAIAMLTTAGTPREVISLINAQLNRVLVNNDVRQKLIAQGFEPSGSTPDELAILLAEEVRRLSAVIREVGVKLD